MSGVTGGTYWSYSARPVASEPAAELRQGRVDVAVVGGGFTGLAAALTLAREHNREVVVLETDSVGGGASGRNAGMVVPSVGKLTLAKRLDTWGPERTRESIELGHAAVRNLVQLVQQHAISAALEPAEWAIQAHTQAAAETLARQEGVYAKLGFDSVSFDTSRQGGGRFGALVHQGCAVVQPLELARGLAAACTAAGVQIVEQVTAHRVSSTSAGAELETSFGRLRAKQLVIATNAYTSGSLHPYFRGRVARFRGYIAVTEPLSERQWETISLPRRRFVTDSRRMVRYWRRLPDERLLFGGPGPLVRRPGAAQTAQVVARDLRRCFPRLGDARVDYAWHGPLAAAWDRIPHVGMVADNIGYALGYAGTGIALSVTSGQSLAHLLSDSSVPPFPLDAPLPRFPLAPLVGLYPVAARVGYGLRDATW